MRSHWLLRYPLWGTRARNLHDRRAGVSLVCLAVVMLLGSGGLVVPRASATPMPALSEAQTDAAVAELVASLRDCTASLSALERWRLASIIHRESHEQGYDPLFIVALIQVESGCSRSARGPGGGVGLTQIQPTTARAVARDAAIPWHGAETLTRPAVNVELGVEYLAQLEDKFDDPLIAMAAYNMGPGRVARMSRQRARGALYVRRVLARYEALIGR